MAVLMVVKSLLRQLSVKSANRKKVWLSWVRVCVCVSLWWAAWHVFHAHNGSHVWEIVFRQHGCDTDVCALKLNQYMHTDTRILLLSPHVFVMCELSYCTPGKVHLHRPSHTQIKLHVLLLPTKHKDMHKQSQYFTISVCEPINEVLWNI